MPASRVRTLTSLASFAWLVVGGYGLWESVAEDAGDSWEISYGIFAIALVIGALLTVATVWNVSRQGDSSPVRWIGFGVCAVGLLSTLVAWALPVWMTLLAIGYALVAVSGSKPWRRPVAYLAGAQLLGVVVMFMGIAAELGPRNEYGDHPAAFGIGLVVMSVATVVALRQLASTAPRELRVTTAVPPSSRG